MSDQPKTTIDGKLVISSEFIYIVNNTAVSTTELEAVNNIHKALLKKKKVFTVAKLGRTFEKEEANSINMELRLCKAPIEPIFDPVMVEDLFLVVMPWTGVCKLELPSGEVYWFTAKVRVTLSIPLGPCEDNFHFQLRELSDGKPEESGLVIWEATYSGKDINVKTISGLTQRELIKAFHRYRETLPRLNVYLANQGYVADTDGYWNNRWTLTHDGKVVSHIDATVCSISRYTNKPG